MFNCRGSIAALFTIAALVGLIVVMGAPEEEMTAAHESIKTSYFEIEGTTLNEMCASLHARGPLDNRSIRREGVTTWNIQWRWPVSASVPQFDRTDVTSAVELLLPRWKDQKKGSPDLIAKWKQYQKALQLHEDGHISRAVQKARVIQKKLRGLGTNVSTAEAEGIAQAELTALRAEDIAYDEETRHGVKQGVMLGCTLETRKVS